MDETQQALARDIEASAYVADADLVSSLFLANALGKPLLIEGEAGVGKTEVAKCLSRVHDATLIRLQCYEGLDAQHALYDWDYQRQLLAIQMLGNDDPSRLKSTLYSEDYLVRRPLLAAIDCDTPVVLLIDEIDRADEEFEALLLEILSDFQISIPELGTFVARSRPHVILTSNGIRELSDALRRRCLYHYMEYPDRDKERRIVQTHLPDIDQRLAGQLVDVMQKLRERMLRKTPGVAETLDWAASLMQLRVRDLAESPEAVLQSLTAVLKTREDRARITEVQTDIAAVLLNGADEPPPSLASAT